MGRNRVVIDENHFIVYGFDGPCGGYFAEYYDVNSDKYQLQDEASDSIGFFRGVNKTQILEFLEKYNATNLARRQTEDAFSKLCLDLPC